MKKYLFAVAITAFVLGCNKEKIYKENLNATWRVYKYLLYNVDKTALFNSRYPNYRITFTKDGNFTEFYTNPDTNIINGSYYFEQNNERLVLEHQYLSLPDSTLKTAKRKFTIFNLTRDHVQLRTDTSQLYMDTLDI
ncbi:MAG: hypothetical protein NZM35_08190 [Chitinophagales bacterium]|nr:hypothetical protein [Chitinophagales bacterium]MDW8420036.1 hypothetical protein [Chitinophagales bacterium]